MPKLININTARRMPRHFLKIIGSTKWMSEKPSSAACFICEYTFQTVDDETIHHLIEAAIYAPNAVNRQSCDIYRHS